MEGGLLGLVRMSSTPIQAQGEPPFRGICPYGALITWPRMGKTHGRSRGQLVAVGRALLMAARWDLFHGRRQGADHFSDGASLVEHLVANGRAFGSPARGCGAWTSSSYTSISILEALTYISAGPVFVGPVRGPRSFASMHLSCSWVQPWPSAREDRLGEFHSLPNLIPGTRPLALHSHHRQ